MTEAVRFRTVRANEFIGGGASFSELLVGGDPVGPATLVSAGGGVSLVEDGAPPALEVRSLAAGANATVTALGGGEVEIAAAAGVSSTLDDAGAVPGGGASLVPGAPQTGPGLAVRTLSAAANVALAAGATDVVVSASVPLARDPAAAGTSLVSGASTGASHLLRGLKSSDGSVTFAVAGEDVDVRTVAGAGDSIPLGSTASATPAAAVGLVAGDSSSTDHRTRDVYGGPGVEVVALGDYVRISPTTGGGGGGATLADQDPTDPNAGSLQTSLIGPSNTASDHRVRQWQRAATDLLWVQDVPGSGATALEVAYDVGGLGRSLAPRSPFLLARYPQATVVHDFSASGFLRVLTTGEAAWFTEFVRTFEYAPPGMAVRLPSTELPGQLYEVEIRADWRRVSGDRQGVGLRFEWVRVDPGPATVFRVHEWKSRHVFEGESSRPVISFRFWHNWTPGDQFQFNLFSTVEGDVEFTTKGSIAIRQW